LSSAMTLKCPCADIDYHQQKPGQNRSSANAAALFIVSCARLLPAMTGRSNPERWPQSGGPH
jgi:hypothetical protein